MEDQPARRPGELSFAARRRLFLVGAAGLGALMLWGLAGLPDYRAFTPFLGQVMNRVAVEERSSTAVVSAVNFDYRGFDTLGEEFMLLCAVTGVSVLLRTAAGFMRRYQ
jgi:multicomponent Na+:H+ antiporter subunit B